MMMRIVVAAAAAAAIVTAAQSQAPPPAASPGVGVLQIQPEVVPPLRSFRIEPQAAPAAPAARPAQDSTRDDSSLTPSRAPAAEPERQEHGASGQRQRRDSVELAVPVQRGRRTRRSETVALDRDAARAMSNAMPGVPAITGAQRDAIVRAILQDGRGVVPDASAPFAVYPVGIRVGQFSLMISPLPPSAVARLPQLGAYGYLVIHDRVLLIDPRTVTVVADLAG
jgi:hypothetical protein